MSSWIHYYFVILVQLVFLDSIILFFFSSPGGVGLLLCWAGAKVDRVVAVGKIGDVGSALLVFGLPAQCSSMEGTPLKVAAGRRT